MNRKDTFIKVRVTDAARQKYLDAAHSRKMSLGEVIRECLDRFAKRVEKERERERAE